MTVEQFSEFPDPAYLDLKSNLNPSRKIGSNSKIRYRSDLSKISLDPFRYIPIFYIQSFRLAFAIQKKSFTKKQFLDIWLQVRAKYDQVKYKNNSEIDVLKGSRFYDPL